MVYSYTYIQGSCVVTDLKLKTTGEKTPSGYSDISITEDDRKYAVVTNFYYNE